MIKKLLMLALTSGLAAKALQMWMDREPARQARDRTDVQRWEDEGGNLPPGGDGQPARKTRARRSSTGAASA